VFIALDNDTGDKLFTSVNDAGVGTGNRLWLVSLTLMIKPCPGFHDTVKNTRAIINCLQQFIVG
jgi:hypothetical protein